MNTIPATIPFTDEDVRLCTEASATLALAEESRALLTAKLLDLAIERLRPAMSSLAERPNLTSPGTTKYEHPCVSLSGAIVGPHVGDWEDPSDGPTAEHIYALFLRDDGKLIQFDYEAIFEETGPLWSLSSWRSHWATEVTEYVDTAAAVREGWDNVETYLTRLAEALRVGTASANGTKKSLDSVCAQLEAAIKAFR